MRVNSGVPYLRAGQGGGAGASGLKQMDINSQVDFRNQRNSSNLSRGGAIGNSSRLQNGGLATSQSSFSNKKSMGTKSQATL